MTANDVTSTQVTGRDLKVMSFDCKSPVSGWKRPKTGVYCTFHILQGCRSQEEAFTSQKVTSHDFKRPEVTLKRRHLTRSHLEVAEEGRKLRIRYISLPTRL